ncbi:type II toxin-antitoxin system PemK/MazF family toxin [Lapidilactobacillus achengensis]|uniref:Type II toxin-antitoxin system PemK/MazF family toxin n=1 Tax=Lapidilactobacillus achengensis TaxID=2486000 RepID=A0ABW1UKD3_9LACO|nr:type II toxin-antitoxin system PemK/MazF family toxin [Lapidilactobacillus achengensis]
MNGIDAYQPHKGDVVLVSFDPSSGQEIRKYRPALVLSNHSYSEKTGLALVCPITHGDHNRFKAPLFIPYHGQNVEGYINPLQFHTFDYQKRGMKFVEQVSKQKLAQTISVVLDIINAQELD